MRNRRTYPRRVSANLLGQTVVAIALAAACLLMLRFTDFNPAGPILLGIGAIFIVIVLGQGIITDIKNGFGYAKKPGGVINEKGLTLYGDMGPTFCPWDSFGQVFATTNHQQPILQHLSVSDLGRQNYD